MPLSRTGPRQQMPCPTLAGIETDIVGKRVGSPRLSPRDYSEQPTIRRTDMMEVTQAKSHSALLEGS